MHQLYLSTIVTSININILLFIYICLYIHVFVDTDAVMADQHTIDGRQVEAKRALPRDKTPNMSSGR